MIDNLPGQDLNRRLFVIHGDQLYSFFFTPIGEEGTAVRSRATRTCVELPSVPGTNPTNG